MLQSAEGPVLTKRLKELTTPVTELQEGLLVSATYDGKSGKAVLKFYDSRSERVWLWEDDSGHLPYCYTKLTRAELDAKGVVVGKNGIVAIEDVPKHDLLTDSEISVRKITASDPLAIGGAPGSLREKIDCWEADIKYYENYLYDKHLRVGTYYKITKGALSPVEKEVVGEVRRSLEPILAKATGDAASYIRDWAELLGQPLASFKRIACDIEVANEENRLPDPEAADRPVIAVSFCNDKESIVYLVDRTGQDRSLEGALTAYSHEVFPDEASLLRAAFSKMMEYPFLITFNGDDFDLRYLKHRAVRKEIGIEEDEIPISLQRQEASLKHGVHIDLYRFFNNRSIQVYVYNNRYTEHTLNGISESLLGKEKIPFEGNIGELSLLKLADYNFNDSEITYLLTSANDSLLMKMLLVISRIAKMPMNDVARLGVSNWTRSMLFYDHRRVGALIPRTDELALKGGASSEAIIKGKKYKGGLVIEPKPGIYFGVSVLDFASLYPSIIKVHNLSYETVNCGHEDCRSNKVPDTDHWVCRKRSGIESLVIGSLRDLRVGHYKVLSKDKTLPKESRDLYATVTQGLKVILNASYGVMGFETFALYCLPVAEATAALGRDAITRTIDKCKQEGVSVIYSDSVTAERCVTVMDPLGRLRVMPIEQFFQLFDGVIHRGDGKEEVRPVGWRTLSTDIKTGKTEWKDVKAVIRHKTGKRIYRVWDKFGSTRVTEDHSLVVSGEGGIMLSRPQELKRKHLLRVSELASEWRHGTIDTFEVLEPVKYRVLYKGRWKTLEAHCDQNWVWYSWTNRKKPIKLKRFIKVGSPEYHALVELLGAYIPEGSASTPETTKSRIGASIACSDIEWLARQKLNYEALFADVKTSIVESNPGIRNLAYASSSGRTVQIQYRDRTHKLQMMNKISAAFFKAFCGQKSSGKYLPDFIFNAPDEFKRLMLENMVKGDGSRVFGKAYSQEYRKKNFRYESKSLRLISGLSTLLLQLGLNHTIGYRPSKRTYAISTSTKYNKSKRSPRILEEEYEGYVYDLSVEGYHTFADSCGSVVLKNTDSLFIENPDKEKVAEVLRWADKALGVELEVDKTYRYVAFSERKKNYFGVLQDGTADIKGLTGKKSVDGETSILARIDGITTFTTVADVYNKFVEKHSVELISVGDDLRTSWAPIDDAMRHEVDDVYLLRTSKGRILKLSGDHSVFFIDAQGRLYSKETRKALPGDVLVGTRFIPQVAPSKSVDLKRYLPETTDRNGMLFSSRAHATTGVPIPRTLPLTKDVGLIFGVFVAEGSTAKDSGSRPNDISQSEISNPEVWRALVAAWSATFGRGIKQFGPPNKRVFYLPILHAELLRETCGARSADKRIPDFIFDAPLEVIEGFLRGLFSGDGYSDGRRISIASESRRLIEETGYLLGYFDIDTRIRACYSSRFGVEYYQLSVIGTSSRRRFQERIGFLQPRFQKMPDSGPRNKELLPISTVGLVDVKASILKRLGLKRFRHVNMHDVRFFNLSLLKHYNEVIDSLARNANDVESAALARIRSMLNSQDVTYDEIIELKRVPGTCVMYDFSVPRTERFVAGNLPTLLHNSQTPEYLKREFYEMLEILGNVYSQDDFAQAKSKIKKLLTDMVTNLKERKIPVEDLSFNVMMGKSIDSYKSTRTMETADRTQLQRRREQKFLHEGGQAMPEPGLSAQMSGLPQHVKAAMLLRNSNKEVKAGEQISYVKTKGAHGVKPTAQAKPEDIDVDKYIEYASSMFDQVLSALDLSFESVVPKTSLDAFWS